MAIWKCREWEQVSLRMLLKWKHPAGTNSNSEQPKILPGCEAGGLWCSAGARSPLCSSSHCLPTAQVFLFKSLGRNFPGKSGAGSVPAQTTANITNDVCDNIWDKLSAPSPTGNTNSSPRIEQHLESSHGCCALRKQH